MPLYFDLHAGRERLALLRRDPHGGQWIEVRTLQGQALGAVAARFLPLGFHWSPDGSTLAFGSNDGRLYLYRPGEAGPQVVFADPALLAGFCEWSADGRRLIFSAFGRAQVAPPNIYCLELDSRQVSQWTNDPGAIDRFPHGSPSGQWAAFQRQFVDEPGVPRRVYLTEGSSGRCFPALDSAEGDTDTGRFCWSPDSAALLITLSRQGRAAEARVVRLQDQAALWSYTSDTLRGAVFSPQGERILCIETGELRWFAYPQGTLLERLPLADYAPLRFDYTGAQVGFAAGANSLYFLGTNFNLYRWKIGGACECLLEENPPARPAYRHETYSVPARDGRPVPVERFIPPAPRRPAILYIHGGPGGAIDPEDPFMLGLLAQGVEFVCTAYRGSSGYGQEHAEANRGEYGRADVWDILAAGFDWKKRTGGERPLVLAGYSYGGFLSLLALAQEQQPWAGGVVMWTVSGMHRMPLHAQRAFPTDAALLAQAKIERSPLAQAGRIRVPLLIFHGALDASATTEEVRAMQASILSQGGACELVIYDDDTHGLVRHRAEIQEAALGFLERFE